MAKMNSRCAREIAVSQPLIDAWAALSTDHNPLHVSSEYAAATPFGGTIAHGHYTLARMEELMLDVAGERWRHGGLLQRVRFRAPVRPDHVYVLTATAHEDTPDAWRLELRDESGELLAAEAEAVIGNGTIWSE